MKRLNDIKYTYKSLSVPGGGFVTGYLFHPVKKDIMYARTDIGGLYRFDFETEKWVSIGDFITEFMHHLSRPLSIALDRDNPDMLFAMCGDNSKHYPKGKASLLISFNKGEEYTEKPVPFHCNGNCASRSAGERLAFKNGRLYFGSVEDGLWVSENMGDSWNRLSFPDDNITFVSVHPEKDIVIIGTAGETTANENNRGHGLYVSYDRGESFEKMYMPEPLDDIRCEHNGFVPYNITLHEESFYITFTHSFRTSPWGRWNDYACDNGGGFDGRLFRYDIIDGKVSFSKDITPVIDGFSDENEKRRLPFGLGGIDVYKNYIIVCSVGGHGDGIFISKDSGKSYRIIKSTDLDRYDIKVPYQKPEYNGGRVPLHWMSCFKLNPFNPDFGLFTTGTGPFALRNITAEPVVTDLSFGMEETVHMNIYGIPKGKNKVIDLVGDLGGFNFRDLDNPCENSFADENNHRYITCLNADYVQENPDIFVSTARGNWTGQTKGGVIYTDDGGDRFINIGYPYGMSEKLDEAIERIKHPNTNSGWTAISADGKTILWTLAYNWQNIPAFGAVRYDTETKEFTKIKIYDLDNNDISESEEAFKIFSDRVLPDSFYAFGDNGQFYVSRDKGESFYRIETPENFPLCKMSGIDGLKLGEIRFLPESEGVCYIAVLDNGLWRVEFGGYKVSAKRISEEGDFVKTVGFGANDNETPMLFISGTLFGEYGFWRSPDGGESWAKINTDKQMFGSVSSMDGDFRQYGRVYIATGCHGGIYGVSEDE